MVRHPYENRLKQLQTWHQTTKNTALIGMYERAISLTNQAAENFIKLSDAVCTEGKAYSSFHDEQITSIVESIQKIVLEKKALDEKFIIESDERERSILNNDMKFNDIARITVQMRCDNFLNNYIFRSQRRNKISCLLKALESSIFLPDEKTFSKGDAINAIEFAVGLVPIAGPTYDAMKKILEHSQQDKAKGLQADSHLNYLDDYCDSVVRWCGRVTYPITKGK
jgi:hypothetical protein